MRIKMGFFLINTFTIFDLCIPARRGDTLHAPDRLFSNYIVSCSADLPSDSSNFYGRRVNPASFR